MRLLQNGRDTLQKTYTGAGKALLFLTSEVRGLQAAAYILALSALLSSILALLRDRLLAHLFGAGSLLDLYYAAFRLPDVVFIAAGALVSAYILIPELSRRDEMAQRKYIDTIVGFFSLLIVVIASGTALFAPTILTLAFPLLFDAAGEELVVMTRILLLQAILLGFSNIAAAITQFKHRYALYALSPIVYNLGIMFGAVSLFPTWGLPGLVWGVVIGALLHLLIQVPPLLREGFMRRLSFRAPEFFFDTIRLSLPRALALSMNQLAFFGLLALAGTLPAGSIAIFMFGYNLHGVPLSIIGASYATAAFPLLAYASAFGQHETFRAQVSAALRQIIFWSLPALALIIVLRAHIVRAVLGSGAFDWTDTRLTAAAFALFSISLLSQGLSLLLIRACYAAGKSAVPFTVSAIVALLTVGLGKIYLSVVENAEVSSFLEAFLRVQDLVGTEVLVLAFAYSVASIIGCFILLVYFRSIFGAFLGNIYRTLFEALIAGFVAGSASYGTLQYIGDITFASTLLSVLTKAGAAGVVGIGAAGVCYYLLKNREFFENAQTLRRRIWKDVEPIASGEQST